MTGTERHRIVRNDEDQYSVWPEDRDIPAGWIAVGFAGTLDECLAEIARTWTDMTPRSVREALARARE